MTFREIAIYADGWNERERERWKEQVTIAHLTAKLSRIPVPVRRGDKDQFPSLASLLPKPPLTRKQKAALLKERLAAWESRVNKHAKKKKKRKS